MALNGLFCADVPLKNYSLTHCILLKSHLYCIDHGSCLNVGAHYGEWVCELIMVSGQRQCQNWRPDNFSGQQDMASAVARAYNRGLGVEPPAASRGRAPGQGIWGGSPPEAESLFGFGCLMGTIFAVFIRVSTDKCMSLPEIQITW